MSKYRYETWKKILTMLDFDKEYSVNNTRPDYAEFVDALKTFAKHWWNFVVKDHGESVTFVMLDPIKCIDELIFFADKKREEERKEPARDDFYTKSYYPENLEAQRKYWDESNLKERQLRGVNGRRNKRSTPASTSTPTNNLNASTGLKTSQNENTIEEPHGGEEETEY